MSTRISFASTTTADDIRDWIEGHNSEIRYETSCVASYKKGIAKDTKKAIAYASKSDAMSRRRHAQVVAGIARWWELLAETLERLCDLRMELKQYETRLARMERKGRGT